MSKVNQLIRRVRAEQRLNCVEIEGELQDCILISDFERIASEFEEKKKRINPVRKFKPCAPKEVENGVITYPDGREKCDSSKAGRCEYHHRTIQMLERQEHRCAWCNGFLTYSGATFDHENGRTSGHVDERIWTEDGRPQNAALHGCCNVERGSTRKPYPYQAQVMQPI